MSNKPDGLDEQSLAVNQLIAEFMSRTDGGESLDIEQFIKEHPDHAVELKQHFANVDLLEGLKEKNSPGNAETILKPKDDSDLSTDDATAKTVMRGGTDSETSVTRQFEEKSNSSATQIEIPETFGRYAIQKVLGQGAMGAVYLARDTQLDRDVALKIPKFSDGNGVDDEELLERFYREARASATLRSPNICPVHDVGEIDGQHYITMAYIEGRPLKDFTKSKKRHSEKQIVTTIRKLALGLAEAHEIGVIHRDLKPANIMVDKKGEPVVMDFGLARRSSSDDVQVTQSGAILGTPAYMSPEQVEGDQSAIGPQTDIYALGVIMYELLTGEMPFKGALITLLSQIAANNPTKPSELRSDLDPRLEKICLKMMAGDLTKRYESMTEVANDLQEVLRHPNRKQKKKANKKSDPKPTSIPSANEESNPALISVEQPKSYAEQLRKKKGKSSSKSPKSSTRLPVTSPSDGNNDDKKKYLIAGGLGGLILLLGIVFLVRVGKYDVQITLDDPSITLSVDGDVLNIKDGQDVYKLSAGEHKLQLQKEGLKTHIEEFTVTKDGKTALRAVVVNGKLDGLLNGEQPARNPAATEVAGPSQVANLPTGLQGSSALKFMGTTAEPFVAKLDNEEPIEEYTVEAWVTSEGPEVTKHFVEVLGPETGAVIRLSQNEVSGWMAYRFHAVVEESPNARVKFSKERTHVANVYSSGKISLFVNGELKGSSPVTKPPMQFDTLRLGPQFKDVNFEGIVDEVRFSRVARYTENFQPAERFEPDDKTVVLYHFDEGEGEVARDSSGNGHDGKISGAKWVHESGVHHSARPAESAFGLEFLDVRNAYVEVPTLKLNQGGPLTVEGFFSWGGGIVGTTVHMGVRDGFRIQRDRRNHASVGWGEIGTASSGSNRVKFSGILKKDRRVHFAAVYTGDTLITFVDGQRAYSSAVADLVFRLSKDSFKIEGRKGDRHEWVRVSSIARYDSDFTPTKDLNPDEHTIALYTFDEGTGDTLHDSSGNGHDGKISGAKWVQVPAAPESEREIAEWILSKGGLVEITASIPDRLRRITTLADLPDGPVDIQVVNISNIDRSGLERISSINNLRRLYIFSSKLSDDDLQLLERQSKLTVLALQYIQGFHGHGLKYLNTPDLTNFSANNSRDFGDEGLKVLSKYRQLGAIGASETSITDAGVELLKDLTELETVSLGSPGVTDRSVEILHGLKKLKRVHLYSESTTQGAIDRLQKALPECHITRAGSGGLKQDRPAENGQAKLLHPPATDSALGSDRSVAEWLLSYGGKFRTNVTSDTYITNVSELPTEDFRITRIQELSLRMDSNSANVAMQQLGSLTECEIMRITDSTFTDDGLAFVKHLPKLHELNLVRVPGVSGRGLANLPDPDAFHNLALNGTNIDDQGSKAISHFPKLKFLDLNHSGINDEQLANLAGLTELDRLWLPSNPITDAGLEHLVGLTKLRDLQLQRTGVTATGIAKLQEKLPNCKIKWDEGVPSQSGSVKAPPPAVAPFDEAQAKVHQKAWADHLGVPVEYENSIGMKFRLIPPGEFMMGGTPNEIEAALKEAEKYDFWRTFINSEAPLHKVILTQPVYLGATEVTQSQYQQVMGVNPSHFSSTGAGKSDLGSIETDNHPVEMVSWNDTADFCAKLSQQEKLKPFYSRSGETVTSLAGTGYRLPTEAEWEFACRAGTTTRFWSGDQEQGLPEAGWIEDNAENRTHAAGVLKANPFGLSDMHGNVWEWVQDSWDKSFYGESQQGAAIDPYKPFSASGWQVFRGGGWNMSAIYSRSSIRFAAPNRTLRFSNRGFRVLLPVDSVKSSK